MITRIGPIGIAKRLVRRLRKIEKLNPRLRVHVYGYDWRLSGHTMSNDFKKFLQNLPSNQAGAKRKGALVVAHSMGGLITQHVVNTNPELFSGVVYASTPFRGVSGILQPIRAGDGVLLNHSLLQATTNFSMRSSFLFLPLNNHVFVDENTGKEVYLNLWDWRTWKRYRLAPWTQNIDDGSATASPSHGAINAANHHRSKTLEPKRRHVEARTQSSSQADNGSCDACARSVGQRAINQINQPTVEEESAEPDPETVKQYLIRTLRDAKMFLKELEYRDDVDYPPMAVMYSSHSMTIRGSRVQGHRGVWEGDYSKFIVAPGDGVVTKRSALMSRAFWDNECIVAHADSHHSHESLLEDLPLLGGCILKILHANCAEKDQNPRCHLTEV